MYVGEVVFALLVITFISVVSSKFYERGRREREKSMRERQREKRERRA